MDLTHIEDTFIDIGGQFLTSSYDLKERLKNIKAFVFDWDGVFNDGRKGLNNTSDFSEVDSMGTNMLRFGHYLSNQSLPKVAIITGEENPAALKLAKREHFDAIYNKVGNKILALEHFCQEHGLSPNEICFFYDDVLDISVAKEVGIRLGVGRLCNPIFSDYLIENHLVDYISACAGQEHAVREFSELLLCLYGKQHEVLDKRATYIGDYQDYLQQRNQSLTKRYALKNGNIESIEFDN